MSRAWAGGSTRAWRKLRAYVLERDGHVCQVPDVDGRPCGRPATDAGHIVPKGEGGADTPDNVRAECEPHNASDGGRLAHAARETPRGWSW